MLESNREIAVIDTPYLSVRRSLMRAIVHRVQLLLSVTFRVPSRTPKPRFTMTGLGDNS